MNIIKEITHIIKKEDSDMNSKEGNGDFFIELNKFQNKLENY
jgi:hypothetical protein